MKTITICGSMRFANEMKKIAFELEAIKGCNVLQCIYNDAAREVTPVMKEHINAAHLEKIKMSDMIYVVDINGYIGESVKKEIEFAREHQKEIVFYSKDFSRKTF